MGYDHAYLPWHFSLRDCQPRLHIIARTCCMMIEGLASRWEPETYPAPPGGVPPFVRPLIF
jgi:hypothetical protein